MATYGMKDAANLTLVDKATKKVTLFIDYANATSSEWSAERVYATKKGTNAIAWDSNRQGTLTIESEMFDLSYLALAIGSDIAVGKNDIMKREAITLDESREVRLEGVIEPESVSVIKLHEDMIEHDGAPIPALTGQRELLPEIVRDLVVGTNENSAVITFAPSLNAVSYEILQDGEVVGTVSQNSFTIEGLTPTTGYEISVRAINEYGTSALSAVVKVTTPEEGVTERTLHEATPQDIADAESQEGTLNDMASNMVTFEVNGNVVKFNDKALVGDSYAIYYLEEVDNVRTITVAADKFPASYEIFADAYIREQETGTDEFVQIHYKNARPQSNFTLTQSATEPTNLSVVFDLFPDKDKKLAEFKVID